jgi:hypothetical protein
LKFKKNTVEFKDYPLVRLRLVPIYFRNDMLESRIGTLLYFIRWSPKEDDVAVVQNLEGKEFYIDSYYFEWKHGKEGRRCGDPRWGRK